MAKILSLRHLLNRLVAVGSLDPEEKSELEKGLNDLSHALDTKNIKGVEKAIIKIVAVLNKINPQP